MTMKRFLLIVIAVVCIVAGSIPVINTKIYGGWNGYERFDRDYHLKKNEILHGCLYFGIEGSLPVKIRRVSVVNKKNLPIEVKVFFGNRQGMQMVGGPIDLKEFEESYGDNCITLDQFTWVTAKDDERFDVVIITREDQIENIRVEIEYSVLGIFPKKILSEELII